MNENQDNNLQNSVENSTPIEPVEMPTPIEAQTPIDEATPVESQAPVVEPTPVAPTSVVEPTPVQPVQPVVEPAPVVTPTPVETPIAQPVTSPVNPAPVTPPTNEKKSNPVLVVLLIIALLAVIGYGVYSYTDILKPKNNSKGNSTTTTTTTTSSMSDYAFASVNEYVTFMAKHKDDRTNFIQETSDFSLLDFDLENKCTADGDKVEFKIGAVNINYVCEDRGYVGAIEKNAWDANVNIDNKVTIKSTSYSGVETQEVYTSGNYYLVIDIVESSIGNDKFTLYDSNGNVVLKDIKYTDHFIKDKSENSDITLLKLINDENILYFVSVDTDKPVDETVCRLKAVNLNGSAKPEINEIGSGTSCYYNGY